MFHTQERRRIRLVAPILCTDESAWLGKAYYFWYDENDAVYWGTTFKTKNTGYYEVYWADIDCEDVFDTVFNEEHYSLWRDEIEKFAKKFEKKMKMKPTLKEINLYFAENGIWDGVTGILFQDIPKRESNTYVKDFYYRKRIQIGVFDKQIISNFALKFDGQ